MGRRPIRIIPLPALKAGNIPVGKKTCPGQAMITDYPRWIKILIKES